MRPLRAGAIVGLACALVALASCREPTEVVIEARTGALAATVYPTFFTVGASAQDVETAFVTASVSARPAGGDGFLGSLVAVPGSSGDSTTFSVKVALAFTPAAATNPDACKPPAYQGCIVARRTLRYVRHTRIVLPISLDESCVDVPCDAVTTCKKGTCVSSTVACDDGGCTEPGAASGGSSGAPAGGPPPTTLPDGAPVDSGSGDGGRDAASDAAGGDGGDAGEKGAIDCQPLTCTSSERCCWDPSQGHGTCGPSGFSCGPGELGIQCTDSAQCGVGALCCAGPAGSNCFTGAACSGNDSEMCHDTGTCTGTGATCTGTYGGYYRICR